MNVSFQGYNQNILTFMCDEDIPTNKLVKLTENGKVSVCALSDIPIGVCVNSREGYAAVQLTGYARMPYNYDEPSFSFQRIRSDENGAVMADSSGKEVIVTDIDTQNKIVGFIM